MTAWLGLILDAILIGVVGAGIWQAIRLIRQLQGLHASRIEMEKFVRDFNSAVIRAEKGVDGLRNAARESGDDLEKLVEKANMVRDELTFIVESADSVAERLTNNASKAMRGDAPSVPSQHPKEVRPAAKPAAKPAAAAQPLKPRREPTPVFSASSERASISRAEQELIQALKKLG